MATWTGWQQQFLDAAGLPTGEATQEFLFIWSNNAQSNCRNNPIDVSHGTSSSFDCHKLTATKTAQAYQSHADATAAFARQITSGSYPYLHAALKSNVVTNQPHPARVADDLKAWGSSKFAAWYLSHSTVGSGVGIGAVSVPKAAHLHKGWEDIRHSINKNMPTALSNANRSLDAGLRAVARARKVRL